jgi:hypothetical protein
MPRTRSIFFHGLGITLRRFPAFLWTCVFSLGLALAFSFPLYTQLSKLLDHSLASQGLSSGFDVSIVTSTVMRIHGDRAGEANAITSHGSIVAYLLLYFFLVPGTLFCYVTRARARLSTLVRQGMSHFWRFVRITLLTLIVAGVILGPLFVLQKRWADFVDDRFVGKTALYLTLAGIFVVFLIASLLRLYFDLVEVYTVQLGTHQRRTGRPDRRVRRTFGPAFRLLRKHLARAWIVFLVLTLLGSAIAFFTTRIAMHMLAQPRVWPMFFIAQIGMFAMIFTRFWQRGAETSLVLQNPIEPESDASSEFEGYPYTRPAPASPPPPPSSPPPPDPDRPHHIEMIYNPDPLTPLYPAPFSPDDPLTAHSMASPPSNAPEPPLDPIPNPEPASPSLDEPDRGVFGHDPDRSHDHGAPQRPKAPDGSPDTPRHE